MNAAPADAFAFCRAHLSDGSASTCPDSIAARCRGDRQMSSACLCLDRPTTMASGLPYATGTGAPVSVATTSAAAGAAGTPQPSVQYVTVVETSVVYACTAAGALAQPTSGVTGGAEAPGGPGSSSPAGSQGFRRLVEPRWRS